ncbi:MAG: hypothetical protein V4568_04175 [Pseudomonadota bacterium]
MAAITINDLPINRTLDRKAMSSISGAGASWVYGWISPYVARSPSADPIVNLYQVNNSYYADQMINQIQVVDVNNSAPNSNINVTLSEGSVNNKL